MQLYALQFCSRANDQDISLINVPQEMKRFVQARVHTVTMDLQDTPKVETLVQNLPDDFREVRCQMHLAAYYFYIDGFIELSVWHRWTSLSTMLVGSEGLGK